MEVDYRGYKNIFVLGAGASVEYGLPTWIELGERIKKKVIERADSYDYGKEIISWIEKVGDQKSYTTIDECIAAESIAREYHSNGPEIEDEIFRAMREIFIDSYTDNDDGWIRKLNEKILQNQNLNGSFAFINYNYDNVLDKNFLNINYLSEKERRLTYRDRLANLSPIIAKVFHPHGFLFFDTPEDQVLHVIKSKHTVKTPDTDFHDVVSCHDSYSHKVFNGDLGGFADGNLYLLGLGGGMQINLSKINFSKRFDEIHVTIKDEKKKSNILDFLSEKFEVSIDEIEIHSSCSDLIESCF
jgi:hypothetical protein